MNPSSFGSVPAAPPVVKPAFVETIKTCMECWQEVTPAAVQTHQGRELCPDCYEAAYIDHLEGLAEQWQEMDWGRHEQAHRRLTRLSDVMLDMGL